MGHSINMLKFLSKWGMEDISQAERLRLLECSERSEWVCCGEEVQCEGILDLVIQVS